VVEVDDDPQVVAVVVHQERRRRADGAPAPDRRAVQVVETSV